jgi:hypothetical protein
MPDMADIALVAIGIFAVGVVVGAIAMATHGINRERQRFKELRRFREEHGTWDDPGAPEYFLLEEPPDGVSLAARRFSGLYVRRPTVHRYDAQQAAHA